MTIQEQELIDQIQRAFEGLRLENGTSLNMTKYYDSGGCMSEFSSLRGPSVLQMLRASA